MTDCPKLPQGWTDLTNMHFSADEGIAYQKKVKNGVTAFIRTRLQYKYADLDDKIAEFKENKFFLSLRGPRGHTVEATRLRRIIIAHGGRHQFGNEFDELVKIAEACIGEAHRGAKQ